jgi:hypothetical protein
MTPERLHECQILINASDASMIRWIGGDYRRFQKWKSGARPVPTNVAAWLERLVVHWRANPPPNVRGQPRYDDDPITASP